MTAAMLDQAQHKAVSRTQLSIKKASEFTVELREKLQNLFGQQHALDAWGVVFELDQNSLGAKIGTPFGPARAVAVNAIVNGKVQIRYVIEKAITLESGAPGHIKVAAVCVDEIGVITSDDGTKMLADLNNLYDHDTNRAVGEIGLSFLHSIGVEERYVAPLPVSI